MTVAAPQVSRQPKVSLNDGQAIPSLGFGVFQVKEGAACEQAVLDALEAGYRHIDTAWIYGNEASVGKAITQSGVPRSDLYLTTKTPFDLKPETIRSIFAESLQKLQTDYVDLYLIHWPMEDALLPGAWGVLEQLKRDGRCRSIGVSNFTVERFEKAFLPKVSSLPTINQIEVHVFNQQRELVDYCRRKGIAVEAYSPLTRGQTLNHPTVVTVAKEIGRTAAQVMIRWVLQKGLVALPKSVTKSRIQENAAVFDFMLSADQMTRLDALNANQSVQDWRPKGFY